MRAGPRREVASRPPTCCGAQLAAEMGRYSGKTCRLLFMLVLTAAFFVAELVSGYLGNSIALLSDSFNMLSDLISLCVGLGSGYIARRGARGSRATYGYARAEVVGALSNAVFLTALCFTIFVEAVLRLARPERIDDPELVLIVGALGLAVNVVGLLVFQDFGACFSRCARGRRARPQHQGDPCGALGSPQGAAAATAPGSDTAVTHRVASAGRKQQEGATVFSNVAGAFRLHPSDRGRFVLPAVLLLLQASGPFYPPIPFLSFCFLTGFLKIPFAVSSAPLLISLPLRFLLPSLPSFFSLSPFSLPSFLLDPPQSSSSALRVAVLILESNSYYWATESIVYPSPCLGLPGLVSIPDRYIVAGLGVGVGLYLSRLFLFIFTCPVLNLKGVYVCEVQGLTASSGFIWAERGRGGDSHMLRGIENNKTAF